MHRSAQRAIAAQGSKLGDLPNKYPLCVVLVGCLLATIGVCLTVTGSFMRAWSETIDELYTPATCVVVDIGSAPQASCSPFLNARHVECFAATWSANVTVEESLLPGGEMTTPTKTKNTNIRNGDNVIMVQEDGFEEQTSIASALAYASSVHPINSTGPCWALFDESTDSAMWERPPSPRQGWLLFGIGLFMFIYFCGIAAAVCIRTRRRANKTENAY